FGRSRSGEGANFVERSASAQSVSHFVSFMTCSLTGFGFEFRPQFLNPKTVESAGLAATKTNQMMPACLGCHIIFLLSPPAKISRRSGRFWTWPGLDLK